MVSLAPESFFDLTYDPYRDLFVDCAYVWEALTRLPSYLAAHLQGNVHGVGCFGRPLPETVVLWDGRLWREGFHILGGDVNRGTHRVVVGGAETTRAIVLHAGCILWDDQIQLGEGVVVEPGALIKGPSRVGGYTEVRQGAYMRGKCLVGPRCVVGHTTEMKGSVLLEGAKAGHFAYIGDSILGRHTNLGAGTKLANLKITGETVTVRCGETKIDTGMRKIGAILGDGTEIGCNAVTNPGTLLGKECRVFPTVSVRSGWYAAGTTLRS